MFSFAFFAGVAWFKSSNEPFIILGFDKVSDDSCTTLAVKGVYSFIVVVMFMLMLSFEWFATKVFCIVSLASLVIALVAWLM